MQTYRLTDGDMPHRTWTFTLLGHPPRGNQTMRGSFGNDPRKLERIRRQRMAMQGQQKKWKERTIWSVRALQVPPLSKIRVTVVFYRRALGVADQSGDQEAMKPIHDGIVAAGVIPKDTRQYLEWLPPEEARFAKDEGARIEVTIEEIEP